MVDIYFANFEDFSSELYEHLSHLLPDFMVREIAGYRFYKDRVPRLLARIMLWQALKVGGKESLIHLWKRNIHNKPFINGWDFFNISHSGQWTLLAVGGTSLGIDIEENKEADYRTIASFFHQDEQEFILGHHNPEHAFYETWVKKESLLKAIGIGFTGEPKSVSCVGSFAHVNDKTWFFKKIYLDPKYTCYLCTEEEGMGVNLKPCTFGKMSYFNLKKKKIYI